jgi:hypothetical protein
MWNEDYFVCMNRLTDDLGKLKKICVESSFRENLKLLSKIHGWLNTSPDSERQKNQRLWLCNAVVKECEKYNVESPSWAVDGSNTKSGN